uniref:protein unc-93 homolog A-like isoform X3 n=1 Tax=Styela clava TaxID=7725 RepID=UPI001939B03C|nr:protein unc-93 homolog A-like isoform X3 [Styela clava]
MSNWQNENDTSNGFKHRTRTFYACSIGFAGYVGATVCLVTLQSSINVKNDLGPKSLFICFICGFGGIFTAPYVLKRFGPKVTLIAGEIIASSYTLANFYPRWFTMFPTAGLSGLISSSFTWSASAVIVHRVATAELTNKIGNQADIATQKYFGIFLGILAFGQIFCNGVTVLILMFFNDYMFPITQQSDTQISNATAYTPVSEYTTMNFSIIDISQCGSRDCPSEYAFSDSNKLAAFVPGQTTRNVLLIWYLIMQLGAALLHFMLMDSIADDFPSQIVDVSRNEEESPTQTLLNKPKENVHWLFKSIKISFIYLTSLQGILSAPVYLLYGLTVSFIWSEFSRAFVTCIVGLSQVGITSALIELIAFVVSMAISRCASTFGMFHIFVFGLCFDVAMYLVVLLWAPTVSTSYLVYIVALMFGITHAVRRNTQYQIGFTLQNVIGGMGLMLTYSWTTAFCVDVKIYVMIGVVVITTVLWMFSYRIYKQKKLRLLFWQHYLNISRVKTTHDIVYSF